MDLISHSAMGAGVATIMIDLNPALSELESDKKVWFLVFMIIASNLPDIDGITKIFGNEKFLRIHRGLTHSVFISLIMSIGLGALMTVFIPGVDISLLIGLSMLATATHILTDLTNNYGIQIGWPLQKTWFRWSITNTADTLILVSHAIGFTIILFLLSNGLELWPVFTVIYILTLVYWIILYFVKRIATKRVKEKYESQGIKRIYVLSRSSAWNWKYICQTKKTNYVGFVEKGVVKEIREVKKGISLSGKTLELLNSNVDFKSFTNFSPIYKVKMNFIRGKKTYYLKDLRYFDKNGMFFFTLNVHVDKNEVKTTSICWSKSKDKRICKIYGK